MFPVTLIKAAFHLAHCESSVDHTCMYLGFYGQSVVMRGYSAVLATFDLILAACVSRLLP